MLEGIHNEMNRSEQPPPKKKEAAKKPEVKKEAEVEQNGNGNGCPDEKQEVNGDDDSGKVTSAFLLRSHSSVLLTLFKQRYCSSER